MNNKTIKYQISDVWNDSEYAVKNHDFIEKTEIRSCVLNPYEY